MQTYSLEILGTLLTIQIDTPIDCRKEFLEVEEMLRHFENTYSRFKKNNWLWELNTTGKGKLPIDGENMLRFALQFAKITDGFFDPTIIDMLEEIGYSKNDQERKIPKNTAITGKNSRQYNNFQNIKIHEDSCMLENGTRIEFGGVGKGYALDLIAKKLSHHSRFLVNFGGDIAVRGGWKVGLEDPDNSDAIIGTVEITEGFFCASSGSKRKIGNYHHLLDPIHGGNSSYCKGTYIFSNMGMLADAFATLSCIVPPETTGEIYEKILQGVLGEVLEKKPILSVGILTTERNWFATSDMFKMLTSEE